MNDKILRALVRLLEETQGLDLRGEAHLAWQDGYRLMTESAHESAPPERKIVQIAEAGVYVEASNEIRSWTTALCNDGTIWFCERGKWKPLPHIPQGEAS